MKRSTVLSLELAPVPTVSFAQVNQWQKDGTAFQITYELASTLPTGVPCYGCVYEIPGEETKYMLTASTPDGAYFGAVVLFGWEEVRCHHRAWGDASDLIFRNDHSITAI